MADIVPWHDYPSNFSNGTKTVEGVGTFMQWIDQVTGHHLGLYILIAAGAISFFVLKNQGYPSGKSMTAAFIGILFLAIILWMMQLISFLTLLVIIFIAIIMGLTAKHEASQGL